MLSLDLFATKEITNAPEHPLAENLELPLADLQKASPAEIWEIQRRGRIPGVVKRIIPLDGISFWEYWWCVPGRLLLPEDVQLLQSDRPRVESILSQLLWLWGGRCLGNKTSRAQDQELIYDWQQVLAFVGQQNLQVDLLDIDFLPMAVKVSDASATLAPVSANHVAVEPAHWHVEFFQLQSIEGCFRLQEPKDLCSCQIWTGKPFIKDLETGETTTAYDLWVSRPLDLTNPPWQQISAVEQS